MRAAALAVVMDATLIRATLVPAFMKLAGEANWWAPRWMRRIHDRIGFSESDLPDEARRSRRYRSRRAFSTTSVNAGCGYITPWAT